MATQVLPTKHQIPLEERKNPKRGHELKKKNQWQYYGVNVRWNRAVTAVAVVVEFYPSMVEITTRILEFQANIYS